MVNIELQRAHSPNNFEAQFMLRVEFDQRTAHFVVFKKSMTRQQVSDALLNLAELVLVTNPP